MKMQLGDMEMDTESGLSYDEDANESDSRTEPPQQTNHSLTAPDSKDAEVPSSDTDLDPDLLYWINQHTAVFHAATALGLTGSGAAWYFFAVTAHPVFALAGLFGLLWTGTSGFLVHRARKQNDRATPETRRLSKRAKRIRDLLLDQPREWRAEELQRELNWTEEKVLTGLAHGVEEGMIREDLDADSGHWVYTASTATLEEDVPERTLPAAERAEKIRQTNESKA